MRTRPLTHTGNRIGNRARREGEKMGQRQFAFVNFLFICKPQI